MLEYKKFEQIADNFQDLIDTKIELFKMESVQRIAYIFASFMRVFILWLLLVIVFIFLSFAAAFYLSFKMGNNYSGFIILAIFYFIILIILLFDQKRLIEKPFLNKIIGVLLR